MNYKKEFFRNLHRWATHQDWCSQVNLTLLWTTKNVGRNDDSTRVSSESVLCSLLMRIQIKTASTEIRISRMSLLLSRDVKTFSQLPSVLAYPWLVHHRKSESLGLALKISPKYPLVPPSVKFSFKVMFSSLFLIPQHQSCGSVKVERLKHPNTEKIVRRNSSQRTKEPFTRAKVIRRPVSQPQIGKAKLDMTETKILQSLLRRFPSALAEINKRLTSQNLLWFTLDTRARR